jgi:hypothetical protein
MRPHIIARCLLCAALALAAHDARAQRAVAKPVVKPAVATGKPAPATPNHTKAPHARPARRVLPA